MRRGRKRWVHRRLSTVCAAGSAVITNGWSGQVTVAGPEIVSGAAGDADSLASL